jgi:hypothetical protein
LLTSATPVGRTGWRRRTRTEKTDRMRGGSGRLRSSLPAWWRATRGRSAPNSPPTPSQIHPSRSRSERRLAGVARRVSLFASANPAGEWRGSMGMCRPRWSRSPRTKRRCGRSTPRASVLRLHRGERGRFLADRELRAIDRGISSPRAALAARPAARRPSGYLGDRLTLDDFPPTRPTLAASSDPVRAPVGSENGNVTNLT